jgi:ankyrin repeat protein
MYGIDYANHLKAIQNISALPRDLCDIITKYVIDPEDISCYLGSASGGGCLEAVKYLFENGADPTARNNFAIIMASSYGHLEIVKWLKDNGADVSGQRNMAVIMACMDGHLEVVKFLHENGADIKTYSHEPYNMAEMNGHLEVVKYLEEHDAGQYIPLKWRGLENMIWCEEMR